MKSFILTGESKIIEYKREYSKTMLKTISAFANYHDGKIFVGVDDNHTVVGVEYPAEVKLNIENAINDGLDPKPYYEIDTVDYFGKTIVVVSVFKGEHTPYMFNQKAYRRSDTSTVQVDRTAYEELILLGRNQSYESMYCTHEDLEFNMLAVRLKALLNIHAFSEDLLITLGLKTNGKYNNAAALLSDSNPIESSAIHLVAYQGETVLEIKDRQQLKNRSILEQFDLCIDFYRKHINISEKISGAYRETVEEVPLVAYREAVANLIVHRDYGRDLDGRIEVFSDRIEVTSPGGLPIGIIEEEYLDGRISLPRNKIVADIFLRLKIIEKLATGIRRIKEYYKKYEAKPVFKVMENSITVILPKVTLPAFNQELSALNALNANQLRIYHLLSEKGAMKRSDIEIELALKKSQTVVLLNEMRELQLIIQIGNGRNTQYKLR